MLFGMDCLFIISTFTLTFLLGLPFLFLVPSSHFSSKYLMAPIFGLGFAGFLATVLYKFGVSHFHLYKMVSGAALLIALILIAKRRYFFGELSTHVKTMGVVFILWLSALIMILVPYWVGGLQFSFFQGWVWDQFSYLGAALSYHHKSFSQIMASTGASYLNDPVSIFGAIDITRRPTSELLFSLLSEVRSHEMYRFGYLYLAIAVSNSILAATFLMTNVFRSSIFRSLIVSMAIFVGFWGQSYIDFNAWSMTVAMPLLLLIVTYVTVAARSIQLKTPLTLVELIPFACLMGFAVYVYPEDTIFHVPGLLIMLIAANFVGWKWKKSKVFLAPSAKVLAAILLGLSFSLLFLRGTIGYFIWAAGFSAQNVMTKAVYAEYLQPLFGQADWFRPLFDNAVDFSNTTVKAENQGVVLLYILKHVFLKGHFELIYYAIVDGFYGFFGMYFLTPLASISQAAQEIWRAVLAVGLISFLWLNFRSYVKAATTFRLYFLFVGIMSGMLLFFLVMTRIFAMARGLYFIAPYCLILFFIPFLISKKTFTLKNVFFVFVILTQFGFGLARIETAAAKRFPMYPLPYTLARTHYFISGKNEYDWNLSRFDNDLKKCHRIYVDVPNGWQEYAVTFYLYSKDKQYVKKSAVKTSFWAVDMAFQPLNGKEDCTFSISKKILADKTEFNQLNLLFKSPKVLKS